MVLRGKQIQRCGPARCAFLTRQAFSPNFDEWSPAVASTWCQPDTVLPDLYLFVPSLAVQSGDGFVRFTIYNPNCTGHRAGPTLHAPWSIRRGGTHVLPLQ